MVTHYENRRFLFGLLFILASFLLTNFDEKVGITFGLILAFDAILYFSDKRILFPFERNSEGRGRSLITAGIFIGIFLALSLLALQILGLAERAISIESIIALQAQIQPFFAGNEIIEFVTFMFFVGFIETPFFFGRVQELLFDFSKTAPTLTQPRAHLILLATAGIFALFHFTARISTLTAGIEAFNQSILITFIFGYVQAFMVVWFKQTREATFMHSAWNGIIQIIK